MFLDAYKRNWLETEGYSFEDKMIDDLSVSPSSSTDHEKAFMSMLLMHFFFFYIRKPWRKRRKRKRRPRRSLTPFISSFFTLAERPSQKRRNNHRLCFCSAASRLILTESHIISSHCSKLDVDHLYMSYADIMAKVRPPL